MVNVPVAWVLGQSDLALALKGGSAGVEREINLALATELPNPFRWLSGGELLLTTGIRLADTSEERVAYLRGLDACNVAAVGFGTGLTHPTVPDDLVRAADEIGLPLFEVPLRTPFAAVVKRVTARLAEQQYDAVLRASRAQPRMTRAVVFGGAQAIVRELARSLASKVLVLDPSGRVVESHPKSLDAALLAEIKEALASDTSTASSSVSLDKTGAAITHQRISVGSDDHGDLVVVSKLPLSHIDQILLGHANSLLALDFEKPARLQAAQNKLNSHALGLLLSTEADLAPAWVQLAAAADSRNNIRVLAASCETASATKVVAAALEEAMNRAGHSLFMQSHDRQVIVVLPGSEDATFARRVSTGIASSVRKLIRVGVSGVHPVDQVVAAVDNAKLAASAAERGGLPLEFSALTGQALLSFDASRRILNAVADTMLTPVEDYDRSNGTELLASLRAFLEANGHWESAAAATGVHRHTLRKRISQTEALLGCNLDIARVRAELLLAIMARGS
ncbi:PucR family transcriptional regulator [Antrihabitans sp. YC3-6]|uniref:PucR family transcriptional regulator n=1 Tax=Antrihabitans stalagmiti TaxID=2799499 RepID=A0A934NNU3_9NOCA|nr:PucR family transcriptional regulator [Antrihabitans stalagmiti]